MSTFTFMLTLTLPKGKNIGKLDTCISVQRTLVIDQISWNNNAYGFMHHLDFRLWEKVWNVLIIPIALFFKLLPIDY